MFVIGRKVVSLLATILVRKRLQLLHEKSFCDENGRPEISDQYFGRKEVARRCIAKIQSGHKVRESGRKVVGKWSESGCKLVIKWSQSGRKVHVKCT